MDELGRVWCFWTRKKVPLKSRNLSQPFRFQIVNLVNLFVNTFFSIIFRFRCIPCACCLLPFCCIENNFHSCPKCGAELGNTEQVRTWAPQVNVAYPVRPTHYPLTQTGGAPRQSKSNPQHLKWFWHQLEYLFPILWHNTEHLPYLRHNPEERLPILL